MFVEMLLKHHFMPQQIKFTSDIKEQAIPKEENPEEGGDKGAPGRKCIQKALGR